MFVVFDRALLARKALKAQQLSASCSCCKDCVSVKLCVCLLINVACLCVAFDRALPARKALKAQQLSASCSCCKDCVSAKLYGFLLINVVCLSYLTGHFRHGRHCRHSS